MFAPALALVLLLAPPSTRPSAPANDSINLPIQSRNEPTAVVELRRKYDQETTDLRARRDARLRALETSTAPAPDIERARKLILDQYEQGQHQLDITYSEARWSALEGTPPANPTTLPAPTAPATPPATQPAP